jgi:hypothetical protein
MRPILGLPMHDSLPTLNASLRADAMLLQITMDAKIAPRIRIIVISNLDLSHCAAARL